jgi:hypothetical protein
MVDFTFPVPSQMRDEGSTVSQTFTFDRSSDGGWRINGKVLHSQTIEHAVAFALKQQMANSFASVGTLVADSEKDKAAARKAKRFLPIADREAAFVKELGKMFDKLTSHKADDLRSWESVFTRESGEAALSPFEVQMQRLVRAGLLAWAKAKGRKLDKMNSPEYKAMAEAYRAKFADRLESEAQAAVDAAESDADDFEFGSDADESEAADE